MPKYLISCAIFIGLSLSDGARAEQTVTEQRQQLFEEIENKTEHLEALIDDKKWQKSEVLAKQISGDVQLLTTLFPLNSKGNGRSKDKVWDEWHKFEGKLNNWSLFYGQIAKASAQRNVDLIEKALSKANSTCRSCHMKYRSLW